LVEVVWHGNLARHKAEPAKLHASPKPTYQPVIPSDLRMRRLAVRADDLYREIRVENHATGESGEKLIENPKR
jgi:hypothetical protein